MGEWVYILHEQCSDRFGRPVSSPIYDQKPWFLLHYHPQAALSWPKSLSLTFPDHHTIGSTVFLSDSSKRPEQGVLCPSFFPSLPPGPFTQQQAPPTTQTSLIRQCLSPWPVWSRPPQGWAETYFCRKTSDKWTWLDLGRESRVIIAIIIIATIIIADSIWTLS